MRLLNHIARRTIRQNSDPTVRLAGAVSHTSAALPDRPVVQLIGEVNHPDFSDAIALLENSALVHASADFSPELIVIAQSRPGAIRSSKIEQLRRRAPLAGVVALLGTWCEGGSRTGRPWPGITRLYWYEFPAWFRRQLKLRAAGCCPDWAQSDFASRHLEAARPCALQTARMPAVACRGVVELCAPHRATALALSDVLQPAGYATVWQRPGQSGPVVWGAVAGIWDGGQLDEREADELAIFCRRLRRYRAPVTAILDFPRRDRVALALECGAATVLGKPWLNDDLLATIEQHLHSHARSDEHSNNRAA
jgi:hypothetical protein